jgi:hypothetical protein
MKEVQVSHFCLDIDIANRILVIDIYVSRNENLQWSMKLSRIALWSRTYKSSIMGQEVSPHECFGHSATATVSLLMWPIVFFQVAP